VIVIVMGVTGSGKTTVGAMLAGACGWEFHDGDDFHPVENVAKMRGGAALDDADRAPWLDRLNRLAIDHERRGAGMVLACSALKQRYRDQLAHGCQSARFVFLDGGKELIRGRLLARQGHYMNPNLLESQFAILERPADALVLDVSADPASLVRRIRERLSI
jgi:gluconokinase